MYRTLTLTSSTPYPKPYPYTPAQVGGMYRTLEMLSYTDSEAWNIPLDDMVELGMALEI